MIKQIKREIVGKVINVTKNNDGFDVKILLPNKGISQNADKIYNMAKKYHYKGGEKKCQKS